MLRVLFVCTGNICRSPTAEGVVRTALADAGLDGHVTVASCGTHGYHVGDRADERAIQAARARGIDIAGHRARKLAHADFATFDLMLAMDRGHLRQLERLRPAGARADLRLMLDYSSTAGDVPDPYYDGPAAFEAVLDLLEAATSGLLADLRQRL